jgi:uncharacterized protein YraI
VTHATVSNTGGANLRCRSLPNTSGAVLALLPAGSQVEVRGSAINGWTPVRCASQNGWASSAYLIASGPPKPTPPPATFGTVSNTGGATLRCRTGAGTSFAVIASLAPGTRVEVRGATSGGWVPVVCAGQNGWVSGAYLTLGNAGAPGQLARSVLPDVG